MVGKVRLKPVVIKAVFTFQFTRLVHHELGTVCLVIDRILLFSYGRKFVYTGQGRSNLIEITVAMIKLDINDAELLHGNPISGHETALGNLIGITALNADIFISSG